MPAVIACGVSESSPRGLLLIGGTAIASLAVILAGQPLLQQLQLRLTPELDGSTLWNQYRWSSDPGQRRQAALLLSTTVNDPSTRQRLLAGQGWGHSSLAAVTLQRQAQTAEQRQASEAAQGLWRNLLQRFPDSAASADARYHLSATNPALQRELRRRQPTHPAALDSAVRDGEELHLARWAPRHPGAAALLRRACNAPLSAATADDRQWLARGLAELGDGPAALRCLNGQPPQPITALALARALLQGDAQQQRTAEAMLVQLSQIQSAPAQGSQEIDIPLTAAELLSAPLKPDAALLEAIPKAVRSRSADVAAAEVRLGRRRDGAAVLSRWPQHPASWQLQWDLAREALLKGQWRQAEDWLGRIPSDQLPEPLAARQQFWLGLAIAKQGRPQAAADIWKRLLAEHPPGFYTWRAEHRLRGTPLPALVTATSSAPELDTWQPLQSGDQEVDELWRLGLVKTALETWQSRHPQPPNANEGVVEGRLRLANGDSWNGLERLWRASLRLVSDDCSTRTLVHRSQQPQTFLNYLSAAGQEASVRRELLQAIAKQESRFSPGVASPVGAIGLMQLMPETAAELAGAPLSKAALQEPRANARLGARYLAQLLRQWQGNAWLAIASYNAGPGAAGRWRNEELTRDPELWVERIPYPETRLYTKKVLGNLWAYLKPADQGCTRSEALRPPGD
ncbi:lytic transglycosylase [Synechococcus sp. BS55D]|nr:lytic transglycosylase domain-containing protein [Synechococcus sp. BS55D]TCD58299.1 lytic transglycosylase [Synechococcus sp. BS55D]